MQKSLTSVVVNSFACTLLLSVIISLTITGLTAPPVYAQETTIYVDPPKITFVPGENDSVGTLFNVSAWVSDVEDLCAYQVCIRYNESIINVTRSFEPTWDPDYVLYNTVYIPVVRHYTGNYTAGGMPYPGEPFAHFNGTGLIHIFEFNITMAPEEEALSCYLNINNSETFVLDRYTIPIPPPPDEASKEDGFYIIVPEFSTWLMMLTLMSATIVILAFQKKRNS